MILKDNSIYKIIKKLYLNYSFRLPNKSYSQEGEDIILKRYFENKTNGFYVDVGAYHPIRFSNTFLFYKMGWTGINIEARPGSKKLFDRVRKRDINIEAAINDGVSELTYYKFNEPALNGFSKDLSYKRNKLDDYKVIEEIKIRTITLAEVLRKNLPEHTMIDFMSVDVEGFDLNVLKSNDWKNYRPNFLLIEDLDINLMKPLNSEIFNYMIDKDYILIAKSYNTLFFRNKH